MNFEIISTIILTVLHLALIVLWLVNAFMSRRKPVKILSVVCSVLWGICFTIDVIKLNLMLMWDDNKVLPTFIKTCLRGESDA